MSAFKIITDSCADLSPEMIAALDVSSIPLTVMFRGENRNDCVDDSIKEVYDGLRNGEIATTAAANPAGWASVMEPALRSGQDVLVLAFSSGLSTTYQSAVIAAADLADKYPQRKILVADTLCASLGQGLLVWYACKKRDEGMTLEQLYHWVEENKLHICHWFTVDDLNRRCRYHAADQAHHPCGQRRPSDQCGQGPWPQGFHRCHGQEGRGTGRQF